jgi:hypothetical protein
MVLRAKHTREGNEVRGEENKANVIINITFYFLKIIVPKAIFVYQLTHLL